MRRDPRSRYRAGPTRKLRRRAVLKNGDCNVLQSRISRRSLRFLQDIFTTLVDTQWRWTLLCFILSFLLSWLGFAVIWWLIAFTHGDFEERHLPPAQLENNWTPCIYNIFSFTSCFLFSIETQHTIGYGGRSTTEECPEAIFVMCIQSVSGVMIQAFMVGIVFAKMTRPKQRTQTLLFSRNAVICQRDGELCLMFRVGDMRKSHIIGANVRAQVIRSKTTKEGEILSQHQQELTVGTDGETGDLFFIWPTIIIHRINESSPFHNMSAEDMLTERFEVVLILEGTIESTGQTTQARSSYLPQEILWGHRFDAMVSYSKERQGYEVDYSLFNSTTQVDTPLCSGRELAEFYRVQDDLRHGAGIPTDEDHLTEKQRWRDYQPINQEQFLAFPDSPRSHNSAENEYHRRSKCSCKCSNCIWHGPQTADVNQSMFDFDPDAIQVMDDVELEKLPEAVNREIMKNSEEIIFEKGEGISTRNLAKLRNEKSKMQEQDSLMREQDSLMQKALINKEKKAAILKSSQEIISEMEKGNGLENIIKDREYKLNEKISEILNSQEDISENKKEDFLERMMVKLNAKSVDVLTDQETICQEKEILESQLVRLDEGKDDIPKTSLHIEEEKLALVKVKEDGKDIRHQIRQPQHEFEKKSKIRSNEFARKDDEACLEKWQKMQKKKYQLIGEQKSSREFNRSLSDNPSTVIFPHKIDRRAFSDFEKNRIDQLVVPYPGQKNPKRNIFLNEKQEFNKSSIDNFSIENDQKSFKTFGRNANQVIVPNQDQRERESSSSEKQKCLLKEFNRGSNDNSVTDNARSFQEFEKKILEEDQKSPRKIKKYPIKSLDRSNGSSVSRPQLNYDFLRRENDNHQVEQCDNVRMENEKALREPLLNRPSKIAIRSKLYINPWSFSPVSDLSPESGFCEGSSEISSREPRSFTRKMLKNIDIDILGRKNSPLESNRLQKNAIEISNPEECATNYVAQTFFYVDNNTQDIDKISLHVNLPSENSIEDNKNSVKHSDTLNTGEQIICTDYEIQAVDEVNKKYRYLNASKKLISNVDDPEEASFTIKKPFVSETKQHSEYQ
nr:PREDICTED: uncharacterized protein LOC105673332 isoform X3 [Linepithema humile]